MPKTFKKLKDGTVEEVFSYTKEDLQKTIAEAQSRADSYDAGGKEYQKLAAQEFAKRDAALAEKAGLEALL